MTDPIDIVELERTDAHDWPADALPALLRLARAAAGVGPTGCHCPRCRELAAALAAFHFTSTSPSSAPTEGHAA